MPPRGWKTVNLPTEMIEQIEKFIEQSEVKRRYAFGNKSEFVRRSISNYMVQIERELAIGSDFMLTPEEHRKRDQEEKEKE